MRINHDIALAGAPLIMELFDSSPGGPKYDLPAQLQFIILHAIEDAGRLHAEGKHAPEPSVN